jgi:hypothetical protein
MIFGHDLNQQMIALSNGQGLSDAFFSYLAANKVNYNATLMKSLDTAHSRIDKQKVEGKEIVNFFSGDLLPENEHFVIFAIRVSAGVGATTDVTPWTAGVSSAELQNATFDLSINGVKWMDKKSLMDFTQAEEEPYSGWILLPRPLIWVAQTELKMPVQFDNAPATANQNLAMELGGWKLIG